MYEQRRIKGKVDEGCMELSSLSTMTIVRLTVTFKNSSQKELCPSICRQRVGAKIQCSSCYTAYHPLCGRIAGLHMEMVDPEGPNEAVKYISLLLTPLSFATLAIPVKTRYTHGNSCIGNPCRPKLKCMALAVHFSVMCKSGQV